MCESISDNLTEKYFVPLDQGNADYADTKNFTFVVVVFFCFFLSILLPYKQLVFCDVFYIVVANSADLSPG